MIEDIIESLIVEIKNGIYKMEKKLLPYLVVISALSVSLSAAFYSVTGIGKMFSGSSTNVMIMMTSLEIAKLILASILYQYWDKLNKLIRIYYIFAVFVLMVITSAGIYGYLSSAYSETAYKVENVDKQVSVLDVKRKMYETQLNDVRIEKQRLNENITDLTKGLSNNTQTFKDKTGAILTTTSSANRKSFEGQLSSTQKRRDELNIKETSINDSITNIDLKKLDLETNADLAGDIGPLKYIAKITNRTVDEVVNWFIIALMLVFDPLAVSLVVGANVIFKDKNKEKEKTDALDEIDKKIEVYNKKESELEKKCSELKSELSEMETKKNNLSQEIENKEKTLVLEYENKKAELEKILLEREKELSFNLGDLNSKIEKMQLEKEKIQKMENDISFEKEMINSERAELEKIKSDIEKEKESLIEDKKDINLKLSQIEESKREIMQLEKNIEVSKEDLARLDEEIKQWESQHWKLKRNPPSSAIVD